MKQLTEFEKKTLYQMFARGEDLERLAKVMEISIERVKKQYRQYLDLPLGEKMRMTLLPEVVTNRVHRLADDIKDIERIEALLPKVDEKALTSLLDIKRKIKERMMKDFASTPEASPKDAGADMDPGLKAEIAEAYRRVFGEEPPPE